MRMRIFICGLALVLGSGCAGQMQQQSATSPGGDCGPLTEPGAQTRLGMIHKLLNEGRPYAALAHLEATGLHNPAARHLRAEILRKTGQLTEAKEIYQVLLAGCLAGAGHHGLGLLAGQAGQLEESIDHLQKARKALPADARVRSDLGYAFLLRGEFSMAQLEFLTARELDPEDTKTARNLYMLFWRQGKQEAAGALGKQYRFAADELQKLQVRALQLPEAQGAK